MTTLSEILNDPAHNGVYRLTGAMPEMSEVIRLDGRKLARKTDLLSAIGHELCFPSYYGGNWDALEECLFDLSWWEGPVVILIEHTEALEGETLQTLVDIWSEAAMAWGKEGRQFVLLLAGAGPPEIPAVD